MRCKPIPRQLYLIAACLFAMAAATPSPAIAAPDYAREKRWAEEVVPGLIVGDPVYLKQTNGHEFLTIYAQAEQAPMAVIVVHGMGLHPNWGMIGDLRRDLNEAGYTTLAVQMPVLEADASYTQYPALFPDAAERLAVSARYLRQQGYQRIAIVSHSNGSRMSRVYMAGNPQEVAAWVALSLTQGDSYDGIKVPILDLYGENDLEHVVNNQQPRKDSLQGNARSKQAAIAGANHFFAGLETRMIAMVRAFLDGIR